MQVACAGEQRAGGPVAEDLRRAASVAGTQLVQREDPLGLLLRERRRDVEGSGGGDRRGRFDPVRPAKDSEAEKAVARREIGSDLHALIVGNAADPGHESSLKKRVLNPGARW